MHTAKVTEAIQDIPLRGWLYDYDAWGGDVWRVFHGQTFKYPREPTAEHKMRMAQRILLLPYDLPCSECSLNLVKELKELPPTDDVLANNESLSRWGVQLHNNVNRRLKKREVSYEEVLEFFYFNSKRDPRKVHFTGPSPIQKMLMEQQQLDALEAKSVPPTTTKPSEVVSLYTLLIAMCVVGFSVAYFNKNVKRKN